MIQAKIDPTSITRIKEKDVESIFDWFEQHQRLFYTLGRCYHRHRQQLEEGFYRSIIKVHKELPRFNGETSFEMWVTSIFIHICRELSDNSSLQVSEEGESSQDLFRALDRLKADEKEAVVLTYVKGIPREELAHLLHTSVEKVKEPLFSGIQSLRKEMGFGLSFNGCKEYHKYYIDYLERDLDRPKKIEFEMHLYHCQNCQEDLGTFQDVLVSLAGKIEDFHMPAGFMENVKDRLKAKEKHRQKKSKKRKKMVLIFASVCALLIAIEVFTGSFTNLYYTWTEEDEQLRTFLQQGLGKRLNLEAESNGVKIKIKSVIADDIQTLVFYEIEDTARDNQYIMNDSGGFYVENEHEIMSRKAYPRYYPPDLTSDINNKEKNVYQGKISLLPLTKDEGTVKLKIKTLQRLIRDSSDQNNITVYEHGAPETGEWNFEIPVTKQPSIEYELDQETEVEGIPIRFDKLMIAPTATILNSSIHNELPVKRIEFLNLDHITINNKMLKTDPYSSYLLSFQKNNGFTFQTSFAPFFGEKPKDINVQFQSIQLTVEDHKMIELDDTKEYPQTFEYAGSTISIDNVEVGDPTEVVISNHEIENRGYEWIQFNIMDKDEKEINSMEMNAEGVLVDINGIEYDMDKDPVPYEEIEQPRYFFTVQTLKLHSNSADKNVIPKKLEIYEYSTTKYLDKNVEISLE
ncbi:sigma-70 family RNA polymerase sigma factor [Bacillus sp. SD088]|uniref:sigma-70 family RNA polymerase sigma factor n=1 Tax=Bacillus sp. SD088 TaxID=2782012 RepID=UPI001A95BC94|nr:sigma-70 family RNA polymerase sigma factor [Bacillus sp. SD088]MBO0992560.1 sigma-70 family RNA polymerase sigma factor [Bacillus sp. SD088]